MATKKSAAETAAEETVIKTAETEKAAETETPKSAWDEELEVIVPRKAKGDDQSWFVCVNDRRFAIPANGKRQMLPRPVAEILTAGIEAEFRAEEMAEEMSRKAEEAARGMSGM